MKLIAQHGLPVAAGLLSRGHLPTYGETPERGADGYRKQ